MITISRINFPIHSKKNCNPFYSTI